MAVTIEQANASLGIQENEGQEPIPIPDNQEENQAQTDEQDNMAEDTSSKEEPKKVSQQNNSESKEEQSSEHMLPWENLLNEEKKDAEEQNKFELLSDKITKTESALAGAIDELKEILTNQDDIDTTEIITKIEEIEALFTKSLTKTEEFLKQQNATTEKLLAKQNSYLLQQINNRFKAIETKQKYLSQKIDKEQPTDNSALTNAQKAALQGIKEEQKELLKDFEKSIEECTKESLKSIEQSTQVSKKSLERLAQFTLPDKLYYTLKWVAILLVIIWSGIIVLGKFGL